MKVSYDSKADAMYIYLSPKKKRVTKTEEMSSGWIADYSGKELVGIEILDAAKVLGSKLKMEEKDSFQPSIAHRIK